MNDPIQWITEVKQSVPHFLDALAEKSKPGFYHYSLSGDLLPISWHWGLGNSVFFLKIVYTLGLRDQYKKDIENAVAYIESFLRRDGTYTDPYVRALSLPRRLCGIGSSYAEMARAETRQSISSLQLFGHHKGMAYTRFCQSANDICNFFDSLDWTKPWHAASHISHEMFFLYTSNVPNKEDLLDVWTNKIASRQQKDGAWYTGNPSVQQKINGAMKIITGLRAADRVRFERPEALIDLCLSAVNDTQACDNFNIVYALTYADTVAHGAHRHDEIVDFMQNRLSLYREYYFPDIGGFSFQKNKANIWYYGAPLSKGKQEPDVHGTTLFLWGMSLIVRVLGKEDAGLHEFVT